MIRQAFGKGQAPGKARSTELVEEDIVLTDASVHIESPVAAAQNAGLDSDGGHCRGRVRIVENCESNPPTNCEEVADLAHFFTTAQHSNTQLISLPNVVVSTGQFVQVISESQS